MQSPTTRLFDCSLSKTAPVMSEIRSPMALEESVTSLWSKAARLPRAEDDCHPPYKQYLAGRARAVCDSGDHLLHQPYEVHVHLLTPITEADPAWE